MEWSASVLYCSGIHCSVLMWQGTVGHAGDCCISAYMCGTCRELLHQCINAAHLPRQRVQRIGRDAPPWPPGYLHTLSGNKQEVSSNKNNSSSIRVCPLYHTHTHKNTAPEAASGSSDCSTTCAPHQAPAVSTHQPTRSAPRCLGLLLPPALLAAPAQQLLARRCVHPPVLQTQ